MPAPSDPSRRFQLHLPLSYRQEPRDDPRVRAWLDRGYRIVQLQRLTDRDALITFERVEPRTATAA